MFHVQSVLSLILFGALIIPEIVHGIAVNSFNALAVGSGQLNDMSNGAPAINVMNGPAAAAAAAEAAAARPVPAQARPVPAQARPVPAQARPVPAQARPVAATNFAVSNSIASGSFAAPASSGAAMSTSFRGNVGGPGSFQNNAGVSLVPVAPANFVATGTGAGAGTGAAPSAIPVGSMYGDNGLMTYVPPPMIMTPYTSYYYMAEAARWARFRQQMQLWAAQLREYYRMMYSSYPYAAYYYGGYPRRV